MVLLGPPASGKGTQAAALSASLRAPHVSTGQLFRETARRGGAVGEVVRRFIDNGQLAPDEITMDVVREWLAARGREPEFIFDGFPRTLPQAAAFDALLAERELGAPRVIFLNVSEADTLARALERQGCLNCGTLYHARFDPPRVAGMCDRCGHGLQRRADDAAATVRERLRQYAELSRPVVEHYRAQGVLREVNGGGPKQLVFAELLRMAKL